ncbi:MAG: hypothetical protein CYPHOPRED_002117 [Cyphobasidiales sp. Tagirdzhanova-0007]|nr:MAG: hypothetical protein CYPHOPRED_002117 [Cyphobasidiales sp. Tagirdzhanova-0007]
MNTLEQCWLAFVTARILPRTIKAATSVALRSLPRNASLAARSKAGRPVAASVSIAGRFASNTPSTDAKSRASALIDSLPGNSIVSKTGIITFLHCPHCLPGESRPGALLGGGRRTNRGQSKTVIAYGSLAAFVL